MIEYGPICGNCQKQYEKRKPPEEPPCATCFIKPWPENEDAIKIFLIIKNQFIMSMNGPVSFNQVAIHKAMDLYCVKNKKQCFEKLLMIESWWIERIKNANS